MSAGAAGKAARAQKGVLSRQMLVDATGQDDLSQVRQVEIIFTQAAVVPAEAMAELPRLQSLTLIDTGLTSIGSIGPSSSCGLQPVSGTLMRLCVTEQKRFRTVGSLRLPVCRDLLLNANGIESLGDLSGCPRVQRLWLWSNRLTSLAGIGGMAELKELWVQDNRLTSLHGLEGLPSLQAVNAAANPISTLADLDRLAILPELRSLALQDAHFGACPVSAARGYRDLVVLALPRLRQLDGVAVTAHARDGAVAKMAGRSAGFAREVHACLATHEQQVSDAQSRISSAAASLAASGDELSASLASLEAAVRKGVAAVAAEADRQWRIRQAAKEVAAREIADAAAGHAAECRRRQALLLQRARTETTLFDWLGRDAEAVEEAAAEAQVAVAGSAGELVVAAASAHSPEFRSVSSAIRAAAAADARWPLPPWVTWAAKVARPGLVAGRGGAVPDEPTPAWLVGSLRGLLAAAGARTGGPAAASEGVVVASSLEAAMAVVGGMAAEELAAMSGGQPATADLAGRLRVPALAVMTGSGRGLWEGMRARSGEPVAVDAAAMPELFREHEALPGCARSLDSAFLVRTSLGGGAEELVGALAAGAIAGSAEGHAAALLEPELVFVACRVAADSPVRAAAEEAGLGEQLEQGAKQVLASLEAVSTAAVTARVTAVARRHGDEEDALDLISTALRRGAVAMAAGKDPDAGAAAQLAAAQAAAADARTSDARHAISGAKASQDAMLRAAARASGLH
ncbi:hypothetical protein FNF28_05489 [Cafeteria roenbergensis]|uniref:U2A'/phosphoprotein 32 family A C-terminal domain-containing protein n=2 Tax=Cafeteria roenbergensis TaxID=33653 RepID=A0A5A8D488_CAFRO|nr:hypothetical protein FNF28_05489 [Cafeteria roenbergensis]